MCVYTHTYKYVYVYNSSAYMHASIHTYMHMPGNPSPLFNGFYMFAFCRTLKKHDCLEFSRYVHVKHTNMNAYMGMHTLRGLHMHVSVCTYACVFVYN